jgi:nitric oxide reductase subunit C
MGPDLTNVVSAADKGAEYARGFLETGTTRMPDFALSAREIDDLVRFLAYVDATGTYPPAKSEISWYGTVDYGPEPARQ